MKKIFSTINRYFLLSQAGLRHDMAKRIMYSLIDVIDDPGAKGFRIEGPKAYAKMLGEEYPYTTPHPVDMHALNLAIEGWKDIVKYGTKAVVGELRHSPRSESMKNPYPTVYHKASQLLQDGKYLEALDLAIEDYAKPWQSSFGGPAWGKIAVQVKEILLLGKKIEEDPSNHDHKVNMVIALNVFDGLAHNTASIMKNLTKLENYENKGEGDSDYKRILELMDAKELRKRLDVWRAIKPEIEGMDSIRFKPLRKKLHDMELEQIRSLTPEEKKQREEDLKIEKATIRFKKQLIGYLTSIDNKCRVIETQINEMKKSSKALEERMKENEQKSIFSFPEFENLRESRSEIIRYVNDINFIIKDVMFYRYKHSLPSDLVDSQVGSTFPEKVTEFQSKNLEKLQKIGRASCRERV